MTHTGSGAERDRAVVEALYAATEAGDWDAAEALLDDDLVLTEADGLPYAGTWRGRGALRATFDHVMAFWRDPSIERHAITAGDSHVVVLLTLHVTAPRSGERLALPMAEDFRIRNGKIVAITPYYFDTAHVARAAR